MNKKGFTLVELMIIIAIFGMLVAIIAVTTDDAHGMEMQKLLPADADTTKAVIRLMKNDPHLVLTVLAYSSSWTHDTVDPLLDESRKVLKTFYAAGISTLRINWLFANKGGLSEDSLPTPATEGIYLYLD